MVASLQPDLLPAVLCRLPASFVDTPGDGGDGQLGFSELDAQHNPEHHAEAAICWPSSNPSYSPTWPAEVLSALQLPRLQGGEAQPHAPHINDARTTTARRGAQGQDRPDCRS